MQIKTDLFDHILDITGTDYNFYWRNGEEDEHIFISGETWEEMLYDLVEEVERLKEVNQDIIEDRNENYVLKAFDPYTEYGISEDNFH